MTFSFVFFFKIFGANQQKKLHLSYSFYFVSFFHFYLPTRGQAAGPSASTASVMLKALSITFKLTHFPSDIKHTHTPIPLHPTFTSTRPEHHARFSHFLRHFTHPACTNGIVRTHQHWCIAIVRRVFRMKPVRQHADATILTYTPHSLHSYTHRHTHGFDTQHRVLYKLRPYRGRHFAPSAIVVDDIPAPTVLLSSAILVHMHP